MYVHVQCTHNLYVYMYMYMYIQLAAALKVLLQLSFTLYQVATIHQATLFLATVAWYVALLHVVGNCC